MKKLVAKDKRKILKNQTFGRYTTISDEYTIEKSFKVKNKSKKRINNIRYIDCKCSCGNIRSVETRILLSGRSLSCGCLAKELNTKKFGKYFTAENGYKKCAKCHITKPVQDYTKNSLTVDKLNTKCYHCLRSLWLVQRYGINADEYEKILQLQNNQCACCGSDNPQVRKKPKNKSNEPSFFVDHCHKTGKIRGLLCHKCNNGLGCLGDNLEGLQKAVDYLKRFEASLEIG